MLIQIDVKLQQNQTVQISITEDPMSKQPLNFYDIQNQIVSQLNQHKVSFEESSKKEGSDKKE